MPDLQQETPDLMSEGDEAEGNNAQPLDSPDG